VGTEWTWQQLSKVCLRTSWSGLVEIGWEGCSRTSTLLKKSWRPSRPVVRQSNNVGAYIKQDGRILRTELPYFDRLTDVLGRGAVGHHLAVRLRTDWVKMLVHDARHDDDHNLHSWKRRTGIRTGWQERTEHLQRSSQLGRGLRFARTGDEMRP